MATFTAAQCRSLVYRYFLVEGWLPRGTTTDNWCDVSAHPGFLRLPAPGDPRVRGRGPRRRAECLGSAAGLGRVVLAASSRSGLEHPDLQCAGAAGHLVRSL